jgi:beta-galactosidase
MKRSRELFDSGWHFYRGEINLSHSVKAGMFGGLADVAPRKSGKHLVVAFVDKEMKHRLEPDKWPEVTLPHDWCVEEPVVRDDDNVTHGFRPGGTGFYRKIFRLDSSDLGRKVALEFDGIFRNSSVWVNGHHLMDHRSGYTSFHVDITDVARYGDEGENCILIRVDAGAVEGWWYEGCGIYRHVWLTKTGRVHVGKWGTYITTPRVSAGKADVSIETTVANETAEPLTVEVETTVLDPRGRAVARKRSTAEIGPDFSAVVRQVVAVKRPELWSPDSPSLYRALTREIGRAHV